VNWRMQSEATRAESPKKLGMEAEMTNAIDQ